MTAPTPIEAPVTRVTLLEDRAQVTREGRITLPAGRATLELAELAPVVADKTLVVRIEADEGSARVLDTRVHRESRVTREERTEAERELLDLLSERRAERTRLEEELRFVQGEIAILASLWETTLSEFGDDSAWGNAPRERWVESTESLRVRDAAARERAGDLNVEVSEIASEIRRLRERIRHLAVDPAVHRTARLVVDVDAPAAGTYDIRIDYVVPGACWRPYYTARLSPDGDSVVFACAACVWQNTGETWENVALRFSTLRPSLGSRPPRLTTDRLRTRRRAATVEVETREETIHTTGLGAAARTEELPGIDDGGDTRELEAPGPSTVPSDGRPHRIPLFEFEAEASTETVIVAELDPCAHRKCVQTNTGSHPILAGPVDLIENGGLVGRTTVLFVAPGERFPLGWGPDPDLRVRRRATSSTEESSLTGAWHSSVVEVVVDVSNIGTETREAEMTERVPVSEIEPVRIAFDTEGTTDGASPDADGFVRFPLRLGPDEQATREVRYVVRRHKSVMGLELGID